MIYTRKERRLVLLSCVFAMLLALPQTVSGMHIMEGYLPVGYSIGWGAICIPFVVLGIISIRKIVKDKKKLLILLAMSGAFIFVISSLKIPSVTGSCSHMTGTGLAAILFGPMVAAVLAVIVLVFQAILLAHGGLTTLGANTFSMGIAGPFLTFGLFLLGNKLKINRKVTVFVAAALGDLFTYCITSVQLALAYPSETGGVMASMVKFLGVFAPTQIPLAIIEGLLTVVIIMGLESFAEPELKDLRHMEVN